MGRKIWRRRREGGKEGEVRMGREKDLYMNTRWKGGRKGGREGETKGGRKNRVERLKWREI